MNRAYDSLICKQFYGNLTAQAYPDIEPFLVDVQEVCMLDTAAILKKRDEEAIPHLEQYAPVWLVDEKIVPDDESVIFNVVFQHNLYGWVRRRYEYDGFANVLYDLGEIMIAEEEALTLQSQHQPYIDLTINDSINAYGG